MRDFVKVRNSLLPILHFRFLQNFDSWRCFFEKILRDLDITRHPIEHRAQLFLLAIISTEINDYRIDEEFFNIELSKQQPEVIEYVKKNKTKIYTQYSLAYYDYILNIDSAYEQYYAAGQIIYHQLFECKIGFKPSENKESIDESVLLLCADQLDDICRANLDFCIYANECISGKHSIGFPSNYTLSHNDSKIISQFLKVKSALNDYFAPKKVCYADKDAFEIELNILAYFIFCNETFYDDVSVLHKKYPVLQFEFVEEDAMSLYRYAQQNDKLGYVAFLRLCYVPGYSFDFDRISKYHLSNEVSEDAEKIIYSICDRFSASLDERQKIFIAFSCVAVIMLTIAISGKFQPGFYTILRIVSSVSFVGFLFERFQTWLKFVILMFLILYNPFVPIHFGDRNVWMFFNVVTIPLLIIPWGMIWSKLNRI